MKLIEKIIRKKLKPTKSSLTIGVNTFSASGSGGFTSLPSMVAMFPKDNAEALKKGSISKLDEIEEIYLKKNQDVKNLIISLGGVITIEDGIANEHYEAIRVTYSTLSLDLNIIIKIYSFTSGEKVIFTKDSQKNKIKFILDHNNISIDIIDLIDFE